MRDVHSTDENHGRFRSSRLRILRKGWFWNAMVFGGLAFGWLGSEFRWARINCPLGKFSNVEGYLASGRPPSRVTKVVVDEGEFFIAYSPLDFRMALPSGPAAYVFDRSGRMVEWTPDTGDDGSFQQDWQMHREKKVAISELRELGTD